jgi:mobilome CxxCx(11)CxxC protein
VWSVVSGWEEELVYASESINSNDRLSSGFAQLGRTNPSDLPQRMDILKVEDQIRRNSDNQKGISEPEQRKGMRAALRQFERACAKCNVVPADMKSTNCPVCGQF